jgi:hypothetical protein
VVGGASVIGGHSAARPLNEPALRGEGHGGGSGGNGGGQSHPKADTPKPDYKTEFSLLSGIDEAKRAGQSRGEAQIKEKLEEWAEIFGIPVKITPLLSQPDRCAAKPVASPSPATSSSKGFNVLYVLVPDPVHTNLALMFDRYVDAVQDALQDNQLRFADFWLPWNVKPEQEPSGFDEREQDKAFRVGRESLPGILIFRGIKTLPPLVVFLIGESPTQGVDVQQWDHAHELAKQLNPSTTVSIVGPSFSGSLPKLGALIRQDPKLTARIASGAVSNSHPSTLLALLPGSEFVSFDAADADYRQKVVTYLTRDKMVVPEKIVELTESETVFGEINPPKETEPPKTEAKTEQKTEQNLMHLQYPRGIAGVREAYEQNSIFGYLGQQGKTNTRLPLRFGDSGEAMDSVPDFAVGLTPVSKESSLGQIARLLNDRAIQVVLLSGTDVMDTMFLLSYLQRNAPNVTVILEGDDALITHAADDLKLHSVFTISPYPLIPELTVQDGTQTDGKFPPIRLYSDPGSQGIYNATMYLVCKEQMGNSEACKSVRCSPPSVVLRDYSTPSTTISKPPLWLSVVGNGGFWPVATLETSDDKQHLPSLPSPAPAIIASQQKHPATVVALLVLTCCCLPFVWFVWFATRLSGWGVTYAVTDDDTRAYRLLLQAGIAIGFLAITMLFLAPASGGWEFTGSHRTTWVIILQMMLTSALLLRLVQFAQAQLDAWDPVTWRDTWIAFAAAGLVLGMAWHLVVPYLWPALSDGSSYRIEQLFRYRAIHLLSGASPVLPLLLMLAAMIYRMRDTLLRLNFSGKEQPKLPLIADMTNGVTPPPMGLPPSNERVVAVNRWLRLWGFNLVGPKDAAVWKSRVAMLLLCAGFVVLCVHADHDLGFHTLTGLRFDAIVRWMLWIVLIVMFYDLTIAMLAWRALKRWCLQPLERSPLRRSFNYVRGFSWQKMIWSNPSARVDDYRVLARDLEAGYSVSNVTQKTDLDSALQSMMSVAANRANDSRIGAMQNAQAYYLQLAILQSQLAHLCGNVIASLANTWKEARAQTITLDDEAWNEEKLERRAHCTAASKEEFCALVYVQYFQQAILQIRRRVLSSVVLYLCIVGAVAGYPVLNRQLQMFALAVVLALLCGPIVLVYAEMHRDPILSRTTETQPGALGVDFFIHIFGTLALPVLGLVATQFPEVTNFVVSWIEPQVSAFK